MKSAGCLLALVCALLNSLAHAAEPPRLKAAHRADYPSGHVTRFDLENSDVQQVIVFRLNSGPNTSFPNRTRSPEASFLSEYEFRDVGAARSRIANRTEVLPWNWRYSSRDNSLSFSENTYQLPRNKMTVIGFDGNDKPFIELRDYSPEAVERLPSELGYKPRIVIAQPAGLGRPHWYDFGEGDGYENGW